VIVTESPFNEPFVCTRAIVCVCVCYVCVRVCIPVWTLTVNQSTMALLQQSLCAVRTGCYCAVEFFYVSFYLFIFFFLTAREFDDDYEVFFLLNVLSDSGLLHTACCTRINNNNNNNIVKKKSGWTLPPKHSRLDNDGVVHRLCVLVWIQCFTY
jgi:hypothetical protein